MLVNSAAASLTVAGSPAMFYSNDSNGYTVTPRTPDSAGALISNVAAGMFMTVIAGSAVTAGTTWTWVLRWGNAGTAGISTIKTDGTVARGDVLVPYSQEGRWSGRALTTELSTASTDVANHHHAAYSRIADTAASLVTSPTFVDVNGFHFS